MLKVSCGAELVLQIRKQKSVDEAKESVPEPKEQAVTVWKTTERFGLTEAGIRCLMTLFGTSSDKRTGNFLRMLASLEEILKEKKTPMSP